ncbi:MAG: DUF3990 domain-containing protein [Clostridia bacterium]|nr:DUF3990 domain-containing protein [Clostridia bacterium]
MLLFHSGLVEIRNPDIYRGRKNADFGQGFYLTTDSAFARRWTRSSKDTVPVINTYQLNTESLEIHRFSRDTEWFTYIFNNRRGRPDSISADVIIGPIANDTIFDTLGILTSGLLSDEQALRLLMVGPVYTQVVIKTPRARNQLEWIESRQLTPETGAEEAFRAEQTAYLNDLGKALQD